MARNFLPSLRGGGSATSHAVAASAAGISGPYGGVFSSTVGGWDMDRAVGEALERCIWVMRCVDVIATNQAWLPLVQRLGDPREGEILNNSRLFKLLNRRANPYETAQQFRYRASAILLLSKRGLFIERQRDAAGVDKALHILPSRLMEPVPDPDLFVKEYKMMTPRGQVTIPRDRVIWIKIRPHPDDPYLQLTPLTASGLAVDTDFLARIYNRNFLLNDGRPGLLINIRSLLNETDAKELKRRFSGGPTGAGRTTVLESEGVDVEDLSVSPRDMEWLQAISGAKEDILLAFGTPESVLGNASGRTYDNADAEKENWWEITELPHCNGFATGLDPLTGSVDDDKYISFDYDGVDVLQRRKKARHDAIAARFQQGLATVDDFFVGTGRKPWNVPGTRALFLPTGVVVAQNPEDQEAVAQLPVLGVAQQMALSQGQPFDYRASGNRMLNSATYQRAQQLAIGSGPQGQKNYIDGEAEEVDGDGIEVKSFFVDSPVIGGEIVRAHPYAPEHATAEGVFSGIIGTWSDQQARVIGQRFQHTKARMFTRHWDGPPPKGRSFDPTRGYKALDANYVVEVKRWQTDLAKSMDRTMQQTAEEHLNRAVRDMYDEGIVNVMRAAGIRRSTGHQDIAGVFGTTQDAKKSVSDLLRPLKRVVRDSANRQSQRLRDRIAELESQGATLKRMQRETEHLIGERSSWRRELSRYLATSIAEGMRHLAYSQAGGLMVKTWNTREDERVRTSHRRVDGTTRVTGKSFTVGGMKMQYPADPRGGVQECAGCRCWLEYTVNPKYEVVFDEYA